jgi:hypothetical protein
MAAERRHSARRLLILRSKTFLSDRLPRRPHFSHPVSRSLRALSIERRPIKQVGAGRGQTGRFPNVSASGVLTVKDGLKRRVSAETQEQMSQTDVISEDLAEDWGKPLDPPPPKG